MCPVNLKGSHVSLYKVLCQGARMSEILGTCEHSADVRSLIKA